MTDFKKTWLPRMLIGAMAGVLAYLLLSFLAQPGSLFGVPLSWDFTFCFDGRVPEALGLVYAAIALGFHALGALVRARRGRAL